MPCDTVTTQSVALAKAMPELLKSALIDQGFKILAAANAADVLAVRGDGSRILWRAGQGLEITASSPAAVQTAITVAYSRTAVSWAAQRAGWKVSAGAAANKLTLTKG